MHLLHADEVNIDAKTTDFFIYAGVVVPPDTAASLSADIENLRKKYGYRDEDLLKFNTVERPKHITGEAHLELKRAVLTSAVKHGVKVLVTFVLHRIATKGMEDARRKAIGRLCYHFHQHLTNVKGTGAVVLDNFKDKELSGLLRELCQHGIDLRYTKGYRLKTIVGYSTSAIGWSPFSSLIDIVAGSIRYAVNGRSNPEKRATALTLLKQLEPMFIRNWCGKEIDHISLSFSPQSIKIEKFRDQYVELREFFAEAGIVAAQKPAPAA